MEHVSPTPVCLVVRQYLEEIAEDPRNEWHGGDPEATLANSLLCACPRCVSISKIDEEEVNDDLNRQGHDEEVIAVPENSGTKSKVRYDRVSKQEIVDTKGECRGTFRSVKFQLLTI